MRHLRLLPLAAVALMQITSIASANPTCALGDARRLSAITELCPFNNGMARIRIDYQWGFVDIHGKLAIAPQFDQLNDFSEDTAPAQLDGQWGLIDKRGAWVIQPFLEELDGFSHGLARARQNGKDGYIDTGGKWIIAPAYKWGGEFSATSAVVQDVDGSYALIDRSGRPIKRFPREITLDMGVSRTGLIAASLHPPTRLVHVDGRSMPFPPGAGRYKDGLFVAAVKTRHGASERDAYGLVDTHGKWVVPARFASLAPFDGALAIAAPLRDNRQATQYGLIDKSGSFVVPARYQSMLGYPNGYLGLHGDDKLNDVLDASGKLLFTAECEGVRVLATAGAISVLSGCEKSWLVHRTAGLIKRADSDWRIQSDAHHILLEQENGAGQFELYNGDGKRVAGSDPAHPFFRRNFDHISLLNAKIVAPDAGRDLPLAVFGNFRDGATGFLTRDYRLVSLSEWEYDSVLLDYSASSAQAVHSPLVMKSSQGFGAVDLQGNWVIAPKFSRLSTFQHGLALGVMGRAENVVVDATGKTYPVPEHVSRLERSRAGVLTGETAQGDVVFDPKTGAVTLLAHAEPDEVGETVEALTPGLKDGRWGLVNDVKAWILAPSLPEKPRPLMHEDRLVGWAHAASTGGADGRRLVGLLDPQGRERVKPRYTNLEIDQESGLIIAQDGDAHSVLAANGKPLLAPISGSYTGLGDGWFKADTKQLHGLVDRRGSWVVKPGPVEFELDSARDPQRRQYAMVGAGPDLQLVDLDGRVSTRAAPLELPHEEPSHWWWIGNGDDEEGTAFHGFNFKQRVRLPGTASASQFSEGVIAFKPSDSQSGNGVGLMDDQGRLLGMYAVDAIDPMVGGMAKVSRRSAPNSTGKRRSPSHDLDAAQYGFIDRAGKLVVPVRFEAAGTYSENRATVVIDSGLALIDERGRILLQGAWQCGRTPVLMDSSKTVLWPEQARAITSCAR